MSNLREKKLFRMSLSLRNRQLLCQNIIVIFHYDLIFPVVSIGVGDAGLVTRRPGFNSPLLRQLVCCRSHPNIFDHRRTKKTAGCAEIAEKLLKGTLKP